MANARLIAAAPTLLVELRESRETIARLTRERDEFRRQVHALYECRYEPDKMLLLAEQYEHTHKIAVKGDPK
jgi:hypothetical protein